MKIAVFSPFVNDSAIGHVTNDTFSVLENNYNVKVDIYTSQSENLIDTNLNVIIFDICELKKSQLEKYDYSIYVLGNNHFFHRECYLASRIRKGIVILHDQTMSGFWKHIFSYDMLPDLWLNERELLFGKLPEYHAQLWDEFVQKYDFQKMPINVSFRPVTENAIGVFTHAEFFAEYIVENFNLPVNHAYIPVVTKFVKNNQERDELDNIIKTAREQGRKIIVSTGIVHPVKRNDKIASVLLSNNELKNKICYIMIGENGGGYCARLIDYSNNELKNSMFLLGRQPDNIMLHAISAADLCINLRYPNSEVCSLSLFEQMSLEKAVVVINSGIYDEVPCNTVIKLDLNPDDLLPTEYNYVSDNPADNYREISGELNAIETTLQKLINNDLELYETGNNAVRFIKECTSKELYAKKFMDYLKDFPKQHQLSELKRRFLSGISAQSTMLFGDFYALPHYVDNLEISIDRLFNKQNANINKSGHIKLGIWYAFPTAFSTLDREGVSVFTSNLCKTLASNYDISFEVWTYSFNLEPVKRVFVNIPSTHLTIVTEQNCFDVLEVETHTFKEFGNINERNFWRLSEVAKLFSKADLFMPVIIYLDDVVYTGKPVVAVGHDLFTVYLRDMYASTENGNEIYHDTLERTTNLARKNATFVIDTPMTRSKQFMPYVKNLRLSKTLIIRMPKNTAQNISFLSECETRKLINTNDPYLFYPTQVRLHKNFQLLISAFSILLKKHQKLKLVLTGNLNDIPAVKELADNLNVNDSIICVNRLTFNQLFSCYKYAVCTPIPTMHEAALSLQAVESMSVGTPVVLTDAEMNVDDIDNIGMHDVIKLIPGNDPKGFADEIECIINNRDIVVKRQEPLFSALTEYSWNDAAREYYTLFKNILDRPTQRDENQENDIQVNC